MPYAGGSIAAQIKYAWQDHDPALSSQDPPVQNTWYTIMDAYDVRLLWCHVIQTNDESAAKDVEVRWTIDGTVYFDADSYEHNAGNYIFKNIYDSALGTSGLTLSSGRVNAADDVDKRGLHVKIEMRMTSAPGTNQVLTGRAVYETLEAT